MAVEIIDLENVKIDGKDVGPLVNVMTDAKLTPHAVAVQAAIAKFVADAAAAKDKEKADALAEQAATATAALAEKDRQAATVQATIAAIVAERAAAITARNAAVAARDIAIAERDALGTKPEAAAIVKARRVKELDAEIAVKQAEKAALQR